MRAVREVTIHFLVIDYTTWIGYVEEMPAINHEADTMKNTLKGVLLELSEFDRTCYPDQSPPLIKYTIRVSNPALPFSTTS